jgi:hypothetical protein
MSTIAEILDRLSGVAVLKERVAETARNVDRSLNWLLDHEKRLIRIETSHQALVNSPPISNADAKTGLTQSGSN